LRQPSDRQATASSDHDLLELSHPAEIGDGVNEWNDQHSKRQALSCLTFARHDGKYDVDGVFNRIKSDRASLFQPHSFWQIKT
jgi:hypothetical protein